MILHVDMDAFYASVEERDRPELKGSPVVVGGRPESRGVVAAANYVSRQFGIHSAMPMATAVRLCESLIIVPPRGEHYAEVSVAIRGIFERYTPIIEPLSLDEAFLDPQGSEKLHGSAETIGRLIKQDIRRELDLVASVGVAPNKFLAKLASDQDKPDGFTVVAPDAVQAFLDPLPVERIWGVGKVAKKRLNGAGIRTVKQLRETSREWIESEFGQVGERLWQLARGIDERQVEVDSETRSVSQETTFAADITRLDHLEGVALQLTEGVCYRLRHSDLKGRTVNLKIRFEDFTTITRARSRPRATFNTSEIWQTASELLNEALGGQRFAVRLLGVGVSGFDGREGAQADLFQIDQENPGADPLDEIADSIRDRYGRDTIRRGGTLRRTRK